MNPTNDSTHNSQKFPRIDAAALIFMEVLLGGVERCAADVNEFKRCGYDPKQLKNMLRGIRESQELVTSPTYETEILTYYEQQMEGGEN